MFVVCDDGDSREKEQQNEQGKVHGSLFFDSHVLPFLLRSTGRSCLCHLLAFPPMRELISLVLYPLFVMIFRWKLEGCPSYVGTGDLRPMGDSPLGFAQRKTGTDNHARLPFSI